MNIATLGIDPGITGALAVCYENDGLRLFIFDYSSVKSSNNILLRIKAKNDIKFAILEKVWFWKNEHDVKKAEVLIRNSEMWATLLKITGINFERYPPVTWRKGLIPSGKVRNKKIYIEKAHNLFPKDILKIKRHDQAEAALMSYRAWMHVSSGMPTRIVK